MNLEEFRKKYAKPLHSNVIVLSRAPMTLPWPIIEHDWYMNTNAALHFAKTGDVSEYGN